MSQNRSTLLKKWLADCFATDTIILTQMTGDAGFRCYYRTKIANKSYIIVDAPNDKSNNAGFLAIQQAFEQQKLSVPKIYFHHQEHGFFCLSDLGEVEFSAGVTAILSESSHSANNSQNGASQSSFNLEPLIHTYKKAISLLPLIQSSSVGNGYALPEYNDKLLTTELGIFPEWLLSTHLSIQLNENEQEQLGQCFQVLKVNALEQPQVTVHRDFHSRNLMVLENEELGIIDFQDAVKGPITYDIVSILRDCYQKLPKASVGLLFDFFIEQLESIPMLNKKITSVNKEQWQRWFDLMGIQRHIKASGIFARLLHRDGKPTYINDIPLTLEYIIDVSENYPELAFLNQLVKEKVLPTVIDQGSKSNLKNSLDISESK